MILEALSLVVMIRTEEKHRNNAPLHNITLYAAMPHQDADIGLHPDGVVSPSFPITHARAILKSQNRTCQVIKWRQFYLGDLVVFGYAPHKNKMIFLLSQEHPGTRKNHRDIIDRGDMPA